MNKIGRQVESCCRFLSKLTNSPFHREKIIRNYEVALPVASIVSYVAYAEQLCAMRLKWMKCVFVRQQAVSRIAEHGHWAAPCVCVVSHQPYNSCFFSVKPFAANEWHGTDFHGWYFSSLPSASVSLYHWHLRGAHRPQRISLGVLKLRSAPKHSTTNMNANNLISHSKVHINTYGLLLCWASVAALLVSCSAHCLWWNGFFFCRLRKTLSILRKRSAWVLPQLLLCYECHARESEHRTLCAYRVACKRLWQYREHRRLRL